jgi:hypothetical protein
MKPSKYRAIPTTVDGIRFDSKREAARYGELKLLEKAGHIRGLTLQVPLVLMAGNDRRTLLRALGGQPERDRRPTAPTDRGESWR